MTIDDSIETRFLLGNVMQIAVLNHAAAFRNSDVEQYFSLVEDGAGFAETILAPLNRPGDEQGISFRKGKVNLPKGFKSAWKRIQKGNWQNICRSLGPDGQPIPESVSIAVKERFFAANPSIYYPLASTIQVGKLIQQHGHADLVSDFGEKLFDCEWAGALGLHEYGDAHHLELPRTIAEQKDGYHAITGIKEWVIAGDHDLTENVVYLITTQLQKTKNGQDKVGLMVVPRFRFEGGQMIDNGVLVDGVHTTSGLKGIPCCKISFGSEKECRGFLLENINMDSAAVFSVLDDWYAQFILHSVAQVGNACFDLQAYSRQSQPDDSLAEGYLESSVMPALIHLKSLNEGLQGAIYMSAFYHDCIQHGAEEQREYFSDLLTLYTSIFTNYAPISSVDAVAKGLRQGGGIAFDSESIIEQSFRDLHTGILIGPDENRVAESFLDEVLPSKEGRLFSQLLKQFETVDAHLVMSESLIETIGVWRDYIGGLIVLFSDIVEGRKQADTRISSLYANQIQKLFGDVIVCYHLIIQAIEAERILSEEGVNFYNLRQEVARDPAFKRWYNKILTAEFFVGHILALQESTIRLIQKKPQATLELL